MSNSQVFILTFISVICCRMCSWWRYSRSDTFCQVWNVRAKGFVSTIPVMLSPRGQAVLEAKILSSASASASKICPRPQTRPGAFVLGLSSSFLFWPRENVCNAGIDNFDSQYITIPLHSIRQPHLLTWTSLCLTFLYCNHSFLGCSVCQQVLPLSREFSLTVA